MTDHELFLDRSDSLAKKMRVSLSELVPLIDLSKGAFFGYRNGKLKISAKAWRKLEAAEKAAGIGVVSALPEVLPEAEPPGEGDRLAAVERGMAAMEATLERLASAVEALAACHEKHHGTSSADRGLAREKSA